MKVKAPTGPMPNYTKKGVAGAQKGMRATQSRTKGSGPKPAKGKTPAY